jgi:hypothetical protein
VNAPHAERKTHLFQRLMPGEHVLVNAVDERAVKIKKEGRRIRHILSHGLTSMVRARIGKLSLAMPLNSRLTPTSVPTAQNELEGK